MDTAAAAPTAPTTEEDTMIYTDALADEAHDAAIEDAIDDPRQYADEYAATGTVAAPASVLPWLVVGRRLATRRGVRLVIEAADHDTACAIARSRWGAGVLIDSATVRGA
jgi:hypothetical protein